MPSGTVLFSCRAPIGHVGIAGVPLWANQGIKGLIPCDDAGSRYLFHMLRASIDELDALGRGNTFREIPSGLLKSFKLPLPPVEIQEAVADFLDDIYLRVSGIAIEPRSLPYPLTEQQRIVARVEALAAKIEEARGLRRAGADETAALVPAAARMLLSQVDTEITELRSWIVDDGIQTGPFGAQLGSQDFVDSGVPVLTIGNVQFGGLRLHDLKHVTSEKSTELSRYAIRPGDILFARMGTVGRCCVVPVEAAGWLINYHIIRVALDQTRVEPRFIHWTIRASADVEQFLENTIRGATREGVNSTIVGSLPCRVPSLSEQRRIVTHLDDLENMTESVRRLQAGTGIELEALMPAILDRAFRGEL